MMHRRVYRAGALAVWLALASAVALAQGGPAPTTVWNGQAVEHIAKESGIAAPILIHSVEPTVPESLRHQKRETPQVLFIVDTEGIPQNVRLIHSSGNAEWDANVVAAMKQSRFRPAMKDGKPVQVELSMEINITLF